jgi:CheY-like chemotaxis protein
MIRPCFIVVDREFPGSISTRKLVIETAKFNVVTAYSAKEAVETLQAFPGVHGVVMDSDVRDMSGDELIRSLKRLQSDIPVIAICGLGHDPCPSADFQLQSFDPESLLGVLRSLKPEEAKDIEKHEGDLHRSV